MAVFSNNPTVQGAWRALQITNAELTQPATLNSPNRLREVKALQAIQEAKLKQVMADDAKKIKAENDAAASAAAEQRLAAARSNQAKADCVGNSNPAQCAYFKEQHGPQITFADIEREKNKANAPSVKRLSLRGLDHLTLGL